MSPSLDIRENRQFASEIKFLITHELADQVRRWARAELSPDPNAGGGDGDTYRVTSLYFDTPGWDVFCRRGSYGKSKLRIRRYGASDFAFLERKLRTGSLLAKRRSLVLLDDVELLAEAKPRQGWAGYWFHRRLLRRGVRPVCQLSYDRTARVRMTSYGPVRLTLDENLVGQPCSEMQFGEDAGELLLADRVVLELKFRFDAPGPFKYLVEEFALTPQRFSKYRHAVGALDLAPVPVQQH